VKPAHHGQRRWLVIVVVVGVLVGLAVAARSPGTSAPGGPPTAPAALVSAPSAESSEWYCTGQTTAAGQLAPGSVILTNAGTRPVAGTIDAVTDTGAKVSAQFSVPARGQLVADVPTPSSGTWISDEVLLAGGGVSVSENLAGPSGFSESPCQSSTSQQWYFPNGSTAGSNTLFVALFNPTSTPDVVDLSFTTAGGVVHPINFEGLVLQPDQTQVEAIAPFVQGQGSVATTVATRTGRLVASELELVGGSAAGLSLVPGSPRTQGTWVIPQAAEVSQGFSSIDIFNPTPTAQDVTVRATLGSGQLAPFHAKVLADSTWILSTSTETRIPLGDPYSAVVESKGGPGVVVGRTVGAPATAAAPQVGLAKAVDGLTTTIGSHVWLVPSPGPAATPVVAGATPAHLGLTNLSGRPESYVISLVEPSGMAALASGQIGPSATFSLSAKLLARVGLTPLIVRTDGAAAVSEDVGPTGTDGVVTMPGIALAAAGRS
jgi:hypothetical protein